MKFAPKTIGIIVVVLLILAGAGYGIFKAFTAPLPGTQVEDLGRDHIEIGSMPTYNSNPPTSGPHYPDWTRSGVFDAPRDDRNLVHSLEHGYIILSYNCTFEEQSYSPKNDLQLATSSANLAPEFSLEKCKSLVSDLTQIYEQKGKTKLIVAPRPHMDGRFALTAWGRIDKWNPSLPLTEDDKKRIINFIEVLRDHGPEKTME